MDIISLTLAKNYTDKRVKEIQPSDVDLSNYVSKKELEDYTQKYVDDAIAAAITSALEGEY